MSLCFETGTNLHWRRVSELVAGSQVALCGSDVYNNFIFVQDVFVRPLKHMLKLTVFLKWFL